MAPVDGGTVQAAGCESGAATPAVPVGRGAGPHGAGGPGGSEGTVSEDYRVKPPPPLEEQVTKGLNPFGAGDDPLRRTHPHLFQYLCNKTWNKLVPREVGSISIRPVPDGFSVTLFCTTEARKYPLTVRHLGELFDALEHALTDPKFPSVELTTGPGAQLLKQKRKALLDAGGAAK
jgi:hypothetical protein